MILFLFNIQIIQQVLVDNHATTTRLVGAKMKAWLCKLRLLHSSRWKRKRDATRFEIPCRGLYHESSNERERERGLKIKRGKQGVCGLLLHVVGDDSINKYINKQNKTPKKKKNQLLCSLNYFKKNCKLVY